jgi:hypothetical protein
MRALKIIGILLIATVTIGSFGILSYASYYWSTNMSSTATTVYADHLAYCENESYWIEVNYFSNERGNGLEVFEVRMSRYTDVDEPQTVDCFKLVYQDGVQFVGTPDFSRRVVQVPIQEAPGVTRNIRTHHYSPTNANFLSTSGGASFNSMERIGVASEWIIDFEGKISKMTQRGVKTMLQNGRNVACTSSVDTTHWFWGNTFYHFDVNHFVMTLYNTIRTYENGLSVRKLDLSNWFTGHTFCQTDRAFTQVGIAHQNYMFANVKVNRDANGLIASSQSIFGMVNEDRNFSVSGINPNDYHRASAVYELTEQDFEITSGLMRLRQSTANFLAEFNNLDVIVRIRLAEGMIGFAFDAFRGLAVRNVHIASDIPRGFVVPYAIPNLTTINVTLGIIGGAA